MEAMNAASRDPKNKITAEYVRELQEAVSKTELELSECKRTVVENTKTVAFWNGILEESLAGIYVIDSGHFSYVNQSFADIFGYASPEEIIDSVEFLELVAPESRDLVFENVRKRTAGEIDEMRYTFTGLRKDGARNVVEVHGRSLEVDGHRSVIGLILDMTDYDRVSGLALYDSLTKLPNRALFEDRLEQVLALARRNQESFTLLFIDLDGFKQVNDTLGHVAGDQVLQETARRLAVLFRDSDTVARYGGDEFVAILMSAGDHKGAARLAARVVESLRTPVHAGQDAIAVSASIGMSVFPRDGEKLGALLEQADLAMYEAKKSGKNTYRFASQD
jgi:diguanylate cyclase (GGDEF)-like protein/PAS domain S-box-containing protein